MASISPAEPAAAHDPQHNPHAVRPATAAAPRVGPVFRKEELIDGKLTRAEYIQVGPHVFAIKRGLLTVVRLEDEWYEDVDDPEALIAALRSSSSLKPDLFTFWQRVPDVAAKHAWPHEVEDIAVLPVTTYEQWWSKQIKSRVRNQVRKAEKKGLVVREVQYDDDFVHGMTRIFNEAPVRQGRPFWHYGKDFETVKQQFSRYIYREHMIGAYFGDELVGFMMLGDAGRFGLTGQIMSSIAHRDKTPNNALIAKAVEICEQRGWTHLVYFFWGSDSLAEFKRRCGFEKMSMPRYNVALSWKGRLALRFGLQHGWKQMLPTRLKSALKRMRSDWYGRSNLFASGSAGKHHANKN